MFKSIGFGVSYLYLLKAQIMSRFNTIGSVYFELFTTKWKQYNTGILFIETFLWKPVGSWDFKSYISTKNWTLTFFDHNTQIVWLRKNIKVENYYYIYSGVYSAQENICNTWIRPQNGTTFRARFMKPSCVYRSPFMKG